MRSIAVPVADREECAIALEAAFELGRSLGSDVVGYHMRPSRDGSEDTRLAISAVWGESWPKQPAKDAAKRAAAARTLFETIAKRHGYRLAKRHGTQRDPGALWREKLGTPDRLMPLIGPINDLIVVSRPKSKTSRKALLVMMSALLDSSAPVLLLPQKALRVSCRHVALAWNRGAQEAEAMRVLLPLLRVAERVSVLTVGDEHRHGPKAKEVVDYLKCHDVAAVEARARGHGGAGLVKAARDTGADLLVSGAYTKGRLRQVIFGGVTEHLLWNTDFPVILKHS